MISDSAYYIVHAHRPVMEEVEHAHKAPGTKEEVMDAEDTTELSLTTTPAPRVNYYLLGAALLLADYVGDIIYHVVPVLGGVPTLVGMVYLCRLVVDRPELQRLMREYVGGGDDG